MSAENKCKTTLGENKVCKDNDTANLNKLTLTNIPTVGPPPTGETMGVGYNVGRALAKGGGLGVL